MGISFQPTLSKEQAALLVNEAMENPRDPKRLAGWAEDRLRLHPELFAADLRAKKENRPTFYYEKAITEGAECFHDVGKAHCQVLVGFLDVKHPNWDANEKEATWNYFFPALAEKFPQLVNKAWRGKLKYSEGPRVAKEMSAPVPPERELALARRRVKKSSSGGLVFAAVLLVFAGGGWYLYRHPSALNGMTGGKQSIVFPSATPAASRPPEKETGGSTAATAPVSPAGKAPSAPVSSDSTGTPSSPAVPTAKPPMAKAAANDAGAAAPMAAADSSMAPAAPAMAAADPSMAPAAPAGDTPPAAGTPPPLFTPPSATPAPVAGSTPPPPVVPRTTAVLTKPVTLQTAYGKVTIKPGTTLKIVGRDGAVVKLNYMNTLIAVPAASTDLEP
jgi:hypothetical protein